VLQYCYLPLHYYKCCNKICITICLLLKGLMDEFRNHQQDIPASPCISSVTYTCLSLYIHYIIFLHGHILSQIFLHVHIPWVPYPCMSTHPQFHTPAYPYTLGYPCMSIYPQLLIPACPHTLRYPSMSTYLQIFLNVNIYSLRYPWMSVHWHENTGIISALMNTTQDLTPGRFR